MMGMSPGIAGIVLMPVTLWLPRLAACVISFVTSMSGISGAVLVAPLQLSFLGVAGPTVSSTSLLFIVIATPGRLAFSLALLLITGTVPGKVIGVWTGSTGSLGFRPIQALLRPAPAV
jgi:uncharacterized membrane protein YfcA